jgi:hypothetical protein
MRYCFFIALFVSFVCANTFQGYDTVRVREKLGADSAYGIIDSLAVRALKATTVTVGSVDSARASHKADTAAKSHFADSSRASHLADSAKKANATAILEMAVPPKSMGWFSYSSLPTPHYSWDGTFDTLKQVLIPEGGGEDTYGTGCGWLRSFLRTGHDEAGHHAYKLDTAVDTAISSYKATLLSTARTIGLVSFNGSANIIPDTTKSSKFASQLVGDVGLTSWSLLVDIKGFSSITTNNIYYKKTGKTVFVYFYIAGTSDADTLTFTLPDTVAVAPIFYSAAVSIRDNGLNTSVTGLVVLTSNTITAKVYKDGTLATWTASSTKRAAGSFMYEAK